MKPLQTDYSDRDAYAECQLEDATAALQNASLVLGTHLMRHWFDEDLLARTQEALLQVQGLVLAKHQALNTRSLEALRAPQGDDHRGVATGDVEDHLRDVPGSVSRDPEDLLPPPRVEREGEVRGEEPLGVVGDGVDRDGDGSGVA